MAKRVDRPPDTTSHNIYDVNGEGQTRTSRIDKNNRVSGILNSKLGRKDHLHGETAHYTRYMSPYYLYSVKEAAIILKKAEDTIRKEAQRTSIGTHKEGRYWFNSKEVEDLKKSFDEKRKNYMQRKKPQEESLIYSLFQRLTKIEQLLHNLLIDRDRFHALLYEWMSNLATRIEDLERGKSREK